MYILEMQKKINKDIILYYMMDIKMDTKHYNSAKKRDSWVYPDQFMQQFFDFPKFLKRMSQENQRQMFSR